LSSIDQPEQQWKNFADFSAVLFLSFALTTAATRAKQAGVNNTALNFVNDSA